MIRNSIYVRSLIFLTIVIGIYAPFFILGKEALKLYPTYKELINLFSLGITIMILQFKLIKTINFVYKKFNILQDEDERKSNEELDKQIQEKSLKSILNIIVGIGCSAVSVIFAIKIIETVNLNLNAVFLFAVIIGAVITYLLLQRITIQLILSKDKK